MFAVAVVAGAYIHWRAVLLLLEWRDASGGCAVPGAAGAGPTADILHQMRAKGHDLLHIDQVGGCKVWLVVPGLPHAVERKDQCCAGRNLFHAYWVQGFNSISGPIANLTLHAGVGCSPPVRSPAPVECSWVARASRGRGGLWWSGKWAGVVKKACMVTKKRGLWNVKLENHRQTLLLDS